MLIPRMHQTVGDVAPYLISQLMGFRLDITRMFPVTWYLRRGLNINTEQTGGGPDQVTETSSLWN